MTIVNETFTDGKVVERVTIDATRDTVVVEADTGKGLEVVESRKLEPHELERATQFDAVSKEDDAHATFLALENPTTDEVVEQVRLLTRQAAARGLTL